MSHYRYHVFFCTNLRADGRQCCHQCNAQAARDYMKRRARELAIPGARVNTAGCMNRCAEGPAIVVYPEAVWYTYVDLDDIEEIIQRHLLEGRIVERLRIPDAHPDADPDVRDRCAPL